MSHEAAKSHAFRRRMATVVMPCLDSEATLEAALESLDRQTIRAELWVILVDNGSTDGSIAIARRYADEVAAVETRGTAHARNEGLRRTRTPFLLSIDADCLATEAWAEMHVTRMMEAAPNVIGTAGRIDPEPGHGWWSQRPETTPHPSFVDADPQYAVGCNACLRTEVLLSLGGFPPFRAEDAVLGQRARAAGYRYAACTDAVVTHRNPDGWRGYYRQMSKVGRYTAEIEGWPSSWGEFGWDRFRHLASGMRHLARGDFAELAASSTEAVALTHGALREYLDAYHRRGGQGPASSGRTAPRDR